MKSNVKNVGWFSRLGTVLILVSISCNQDNLDNVDKDTCQYKLLQECKLVDVYCTISKDELEGSWNEYEFGYAITGFGWTLDDPELVRHNYEFNGKRINFDARREGEDDYGNSWSISAEMEIVFSDDFKFIESVTANWEETYSLGDSYYNTHFSLYDIPADGCLNDPHVIRYKIGGLYSLNPDFQITQDHVKTFNSTGNYYFSYYDNPEGVNSDWDIGGIDIPDEVNVPKPEFIIQIHNM